MVISDIGILLEMFGFVLLLGGIRNFLDKQHLKSQLNFKVFFSWHWCKKNATAVGIYLVILGLILQFSFLN